MEVLYTDFKSLIVVFVLFSMSMSLFKLSFEIMKWENRDIDEDKKE